MSTKLYFAPGQPAEAAAMGWRVVIRRSRRTVVPGVRTQRYRVIVTGRNGEPIFTSEHYTNKADAVNLVQGYPGCRVIDETGI